MMIQSRLVKGLCAGAGLKKLWKSCIFFRTRLMKAQKYPVATYVCESWTIKKDGRAKSEVSVADFGRSWPVMKTSEWVFETTVVGRSLKQWKLSYFEHMLWKSGDCL